MLFKQSMIYKKFKSTEARKKVSFRNNGCSIGSRPVHIQLCIYRIINFYIFSLCFCFLNDLWWLYNPRVYIINVLCFHIYSATIYIYPSSAQTWRLSNISSTINTIQNNPEWEKWWKITLMNKKLQLETYKTSK